MNSNKQEKLKDLLEAKKYVYPTLLEFKEQGISLKVYGVNTETPIGIGSVVDIIREDIIRPRRIEKHSGIGFVVSTPSSIEGYKRFYSVNMWKTFEDGNYRHISDNTLFGETRLEEVTKFKKTSDNICTLESPIIAAEGKLWNDVILGKISLDQYLTRFVEKPYENRKFNYVR